MCSRAPANVSGISRELKCATEEQARNLESLIAREREEADRRKLAQKKREDEEKAKAAAEAKLKATAPGRQKVSDLLTKDEDKRRAAELKKSADAKNQELQRSLATYQKKSNECLLVEMGWGVGSPEVKACSARDQQARLAKQSTTGQPLAPSPLTKQQFDYLKQNAAGLQPEQRMIDPKAPSSHAAGGPQALSTFICGSPPNQYPCPIEIGRSLPKDEPKPAPLRNPFSEPTPEAYAKSRAEQEAAAKREWDQLVRQAQSRAPQSADSRASQYLDLCDLGGCGCTFGVAGIGRLQRWCTGHLTWKKCGEYFCGRQ